MKTIDCALLAYMSALFRLRLTLSRSRWITPPLRTLSSMIVCDMCFREPQLDRECNRWRVTVSCHSWLKTLYAEILRDLFLRLVPNGLSPTWETEYA